VVRAPSTARNARWRQARRAQPSLFTSDAREVFHISTGIHSATQMSALHATRDRHDADLQILEQTDRDRTDPPPPTGGAIRKHVYAAARAELAAHPELRDPLDQLEHVKVVCARAHLPGYERHVVSAVETARRRRSVRGP
jgi:hypothetical protein